MVLFAQISLALLLTVLGWYVASRLNLPAAAIIGPMLLTGAAACLGLLQVSFPVWSLVMVQASIGAFLGLTVDRPTLTRLGTMLRPVTLATVWIVLSALLIGFLVAYLTPLDLSTALLGTAPGGIAEMTAMSLSFQADMALVATLQLVRLVSTNVSIPFVVRRRVGRVTTPAHSAPTPSPANGPTGRLIPWPVSLLLGLAGGFLFTGLGVPAGSVIGAMIVVAALQVARGNLEPPPEWLRIAAQAGIGLSVGATFSSQTLIELRQAFLIVIVATVATITSGLALAQLFHRWLRWDMPTALLACAPGGLTQMAIIADELGAQPFIVSLFQMSRVLTVILILPLVFRLFL